MKIQIIQENQNPLLKRKEVQASIEADITPSKKEVVKLLSEKFSTKQENINIKKIHGKFGSKDFKVTAHIYASEDDKDKVVPKSKKDVGTQESAPQEKQLSEPQQPKVESLDNSLIKSSEPASEQSKT